MSYSSAKERSRLSVVELVYFQAPGQEPLASEARFGHWLETEEQPFLRQLKVGVAWQPLPAGWLDRVSLLLLENNGTTRLEITTVGTAPEWLPHWQLGPGQTLRGQPTDLAALRLRSLVEPGRCRLTLIPE